MKNEPAIEINQQAERPKNYQKVSNLPENPKNPKASLQKPRFKKEPRRQQHPDLEVTQVALRN